MPAEESLARWRGMLCCCRAASRRRKMSGRAWTEQDASVAALRPDLAKMSDPIMSRLASLARQGQEAGCRPAADRSAEIHGLLPYLILWDVEARSAALSQSHMRNACGRIFGRNVGRQ